ncbi:MAG: hypothetical protein ACKO0Z_09740 [Betaproteobacteria bacterium]
MPTPFQRRTRGDAASAYDYFAITPSDSTNFSNQVVGIYVGGAGAVVAVRPDGTAVTFAGTLAGTVLPICAIRVNSTSTTATNLVGLY